MQKVSRWCYKKVQNLSFAVEWIAFFGTSLNDWTELESFENGLTKSLKRKLFNLPENWPLVAISTLIFSHGLEMEKWPNCNSVYRSMSRAQKKWKKIKASDFDLEHQWHPQIDMPSFNMTYDVQCSYIEIAWLFDLYLKVFNRLCPLPPFYFQ